MTYRGNFSSVQFGMTGFGVGTAGSGVGGSEATGVGVGDWVGVDWVSDWVIVDEG